jgi:hypothetical protein
VLDSARAPGMECAFATASWTGSVAASQAGSATFVRFVFLLRLYGWRVLFWSSLCKVAHAHYTSHSPMCMLIAEWVVRVVSRVADMVLLVME